MRRLVYVAFGTTLAVLVYRRAEKAIERFTPAGLAGSLADSLSLLGMGVHDFASEVRLAMTEREADLRLALGLDSNPAQVTGRVLTAAEPRPEAHRPGAAWPAAPRPGLTARE